jgi:hypothetical protein
MDSSFSELEATAMKTEGKTFLGRDGVTR